MTQPAKTTLMPGLMWEGLGWLHRMGRLKRKQQGLNLSGWLQKEQKPRSRSPSWKPKTRERRLCHLGEQCCLKFGWIGWQWHCCMLTSGCCHYRCWSSEPKQKMGQSLTEKSWRNPLRWLGSQKWHSDYRWSEQKTRPQTAK